MSSLLIAGILLFLVPAGAAAQVVPPQQRRIVAPLLPAQTLTRLANELSGELALQHIEELVTTHGYSNDLDRTAYILRPGETAPPEEIQRMWRTTRAAVEAARRAMKPASRSPDLVPTCG